MYMQYFIGYSSFSNEEPFDPSLFVDFRKRLGKDQINLINEKILGLREEENQEVENKEEKAIVTPAVNQGSCIVDATACPQDISYPTDLNLLNDAREKSERIIDLLYPLTELPAKPRTYRKEARKKYLKTAQKKAKTKKEIRKALNQ